MGLSGIILGIINIAITIGILILVGLIIVWFLNWFGVPVPEQIKRAFLFIVGMIGLYMIVALLFGLPSVGVLGSRRLL